MSENDAGTFLMTVTSSMEADMIESLLKANDIPVLRKYRESGGYMMIMMGGTIYGVDLYVPDDMLDKAREIVENSREASEDAAFPDNVKSEEAAGEDMEENREVSEEEGEDSEETGEFPDEEGKDTEEDIGGSEADDVVGQPEEEPETSGDGIAQNQLKNEADSHEEQYRLAIKNTDRRRRSRAWMTLLFFILLILIITMLVKYLYGLFAV